MLQRRAGNWRGDPSRALAADTYAKLRTPIRACYKTASAYSAEPPACELRAGARSCLKLCAGRGRPVMDPRHTLTVGYRARLATSGHGRYEKVAVMTSGQHVDAAFSSVDEPVGLDVLHIIFVGTGMAGLHGMCASMTRVRFEEEHVCRVKMRRWRADTEPRLAASAPHLSPSAAWNL